MPDLTAKDLALALFAALTLVALLASPHAPGGSPGAAFATTSLVF